MTTLEDAKQLEMNGPERWYVVNGNKWRLTSGDTILRILLDDDEITYKTLISRPDRLPHTVGDFYDLEDAKAACLWDIEGNQERVSEIEAELDNRPVVFCRIQNGEYERDIMGQVALCTAISAKLFLADTRIPLKHAIHGKFERYTGEQQ
jgi:hypothetical protein